MKAVVLRSTGGVGALRVEEVECPQPAEGEVLIRVAATAVDPVEWKIRRDLVAHEPPAVLGESVAGTVEVSNAAGFAAGDDVFGVATSGAQAEYAVAPALSIARKPDGVTFEHAAALPVSATTAWQGLFDCGRLERGQTVLVAGSTGGVGDLAVQLARRAGARVIDRTRSDVADDVRDVDVALDTVGGATTSALLAVVREGGTLVTVASPPEPAACSHRVWVKTLVAKPNPATLVLIGELVASAALRVEIADRLSLNDLSRVHDLGESWHAPGTIILAPAA